MQSKQIQQYKDGILINTWKSAKEAQRIAGFNPSLIRQACLGNRKSHKGFQWKYVNDQDIQPKYGIKKPVCYKDNTQTLIFKSKKELADYLNISEATVYNLLLHRKKQNNNYIIEYYNEC